MDGRKPLASAGALLALPVKFHVPDAVWYGQCLSSSCCTGYSSHTEVGTIHSHESHHNLLCCRSGSSVVWKKASDFECSCMYSLQWYMKTKGWAQDSDDLGYRVPQRLQTNCEHWWSHDLSKSHTKLRLNQLTWSFSMI